VRRGLFLALAVAVVAVTSAHATARRALVVYSAASGHRIVGFSLDRKWLALAEDPLGGGCPLVVLETAPSGDEQTLTRPNGATCKLGGRFWVRPGGRVVGNAIEKALWIVRSGSTAEAIKASPSEPEVVLRRVSGIQSDGPFLGPVVAQNWLRLFASYGLLPDGTEDGGVISGNDKELWTATGPVAALGLDHDEHIVSVGADGSIAIWHAHGARYGQVPDAHARAAALDAGEVFVLRSDAPRLDIRRLDGSLVRSWPIAPNAAPLLDAYVPGGVAVYMAGNAVHELRLESGADTVVARAPAGSKLLDAQISNDFLAYAYAGGPGGRGRVVVLGRVS
jgi:hypothetical protein